MMTANPSPKQVRRLVIEAFRRLGATPKGLFDLDEEVLVRDGRYIARTYRVESLMAMWLLDIGLVQFYDAEGNMLSTLDLLAEPDERRMAA
jgi:hypothetical protein